MVSMFISRQARISPKVLLFYKVMAIL